MPSGPSKIYVFRGGNFFNSGPAGYDPYRKLKIILFIILALYLYHLYLSGTQTMIAQFLQTAILIPIILISLTFHEFSHALMADFLGDPTPRHMGRLSLNPMNHLDLFGTILLFFSNFGWAKPVPVDPRNFRVPDRAMMSVALAGPLSNIVLAFLGGVFCKVFTMTQSGIPPIPLLQTTLTGVTLIIFIKMNLGLAFFNLIPLPPLDGSKVLSFFLSPRLRFRYQEYEPMGPIFLILFVSFGLVGKLLELPIQFSFELIFKSLSLI